MTAINLKLKLWLISDAMRYVDTYAIIAETEAEARKIWRKAFDPMGTGRSWIHTIQEMYYDEVLELGLSILNEDMFDQYCPF